MKSVLDATNAFVRAVASVRVSTAPDENGNSRIEVDGSLCVSCGACFDVCEHNARVFEDLKKGERISPAEYRSPVLQLWDT